MDNILIERILCVSEKDVMQISDLMSQLSERYQEKDICQSDINSVINSISRLFVARVSEKIVGMITMSLYTTLGGTKIWIEDFVVDTKWRGKDIATMLFLKVKEEAIQLNADKIYLTSGNFRKRAHSFYHKMGMLKRDTCVFEIKL